MSFEQPRSSPANGPVRVPKSAEVIADTIRKRIVRGELQEGNALPSESVMLRTFAISRPTLREALRILEAEGLITVVRGSRTGARVHRPKVEGVARYAGFVLQTQDTEIGDIYEARLAIEPYMARQLAVKRPAGAVKRLRCEVERLTALVEEQRYRDFMVGVAEFHLILMEVGGNKTVYFLTRMLQDLVVQWQVRFLSRHPIPATDQRRMGLSGVRSFTKLIELIEAGDADRAESHWRLHIINANKAWLPKDEQFTKLDVFGYS